MVRTKVNKSKAVREYLEKHPDSSPSEVVGALALEGVSIAAGLVSNIKSKLNSGRKGKRQAAKTDEPTFGVSLLVAAKRFSVDSGGIDKAKKILEVLAMIQ